MMALSARPAATPSTLNSSTHRLTGLPPRTSRPFAALPGVAWSSSASASTSTGEDTGRWAAPRRIRLRASPAPTEPLADGGRYLVDRRAGGRWHPWSPLRRSARPDQAISGLLWRPIAIRSQGIPPRRTSGFPNPIALRIVKASLPNGKKILFATTLKDVCPVFPLRPGRPLSHEMGAGGTLQIDQGVSARELPRQNPSADLPGITGHQPILSSYPHPRASERASYMKSNRRPLPEAFVSRCFTRSGSHLEQPNLRPVPALATFMRRGNLLEPVQKTT